MLSLTEGKKQDGSMLADSQLLTYFSQYAVFSTRQAMCLYDDPAYSLRVNFMAPFRNGVMTPQMEEFNKCMSGVRVSMEWLFGDIIQYFKFMDLKKPKNRSQLYWKLSSPLNFDIYIFFYFYFIIFSGNEIPIVLVSVPKFDVLKKGEEIMIACNVTRVVNLSGLKLKRISWFKDGVRVQTVRCPLPNVPEDTLQPLVVKDGALFATGGLLLIVL